MHGVRQICGLGPAFFSARWVCVTFHGSFCQQRFFSSSRSLRTHRSRQQRSSDSSAMRRMPLSPARPSSRRTKAPACRVRVSRTRTASSCSRLCRPVRIRVKVELTGFKALQNRGMQLGAGQTVRQAFTLEVGAMAETITVAGEAPLIETAASVQSDTLGSQEVRELPVSRRNLTNLMSLTTGVSTSGDGMVQMNGVAAGGTGITVDGTEANSNPEARSMSQYGGQNQISVMSLDSVSEVQIVKGVLPAEYGGVAGGQINVISRSGTNNFHGSMFYSGQNEKWNARNFFSTAQQPVGTFNQYGGTLGGPVLRRAKRSSSAPTKAIARRFSRTSAPRCRIKPCVTRSCARCRSPKRKPSSISCTCPPSPSCRRPALLTHRSARGAGLASGAGPKITSSRKPMSPC